MFYEFTKFMHPDMKTNTLYNLLLSLLHHYLLVGLYEFLFKFMPEPESNIWGVRIANLFTAVPNDNDLEQTFRKNRKEHVHVR